MVDSSPNYFKYWGKAKPTRIDDGLPRYHLLPYHSLDVAAVGSLLLDTNKPLCQSLARQLCVKPEWLQQWFVFCLTLHDLGKFCRAFQNLVPDLSDDLVQFAGEFTYQERHDTLGFSLWKKCLQPLLCDVIPPQHSQYIERWLEIVCGHHGQPPKKLQSIKPFLHQDDESAVEAFVRDLLALWPIDFSPLSTIDKKVFSRVSWQLAGVAVLADWLGSNQTIFKYVDTPAALKDYWNQIALPRAHETINTVQLCPRSVNPFESITQQFDFISVSTATPLQQYTQQVKLDGGQQLFILEDVTGAGKTEAAMVLVHRLMAAGLANGVYVGLPTMATANAMYERMAKSYQSLYAAGERPSLVLAHGASKLSEAFSNSVSLGSQQADNNYEQDELSASAYCNQWLADSRKKALLADVGVGTIDQALLGVLPARHQSLRLLGLTNKVLLVDEVHAFDAYMRQLLVALLAAHAAQGGSVILLSATLPFSYRAELTKAFAYGLAEAEPQLIKLHEYPLATQFNANSLSETGIDTRASVKRSVTVCRLGNEAEALAVIQTAVKNKQCVCWIRNTVKDARQAYSMLQQQEGLDEHALTLFHSRYAMVDRQTIEQGVLNRFGKASSNTERAGHVLIATQVVEQSLDIDLDVMISDLAPVDILIQRAGRLQRHVRKSNGDLALTDGKEQRPAPCLYVLAPAPEQAVDAEWLKALLPGTQAVYPDVGRLWLGLQALLGSKGFTMPNDARRLIEGVYGEGVELKVPECLQQASSEAKAEQQAKRGMGDFNCLKLTKGYTQKSAAHSGGWDEEVRIPTRLGDNSVMVALACFEGETLQPYARHKHRSTAWALSQIQLPEKDWEAVSKTFSKQWLQKIEDLKSRELGLKWVEILPLEGDVLAMYDAMGGWNPCEAGNAK